MAQGQLPLYYKNSKLVGAGSKTKWSEYYLLVVTLFGFLMLFAGILWFLPSIDADDGYTKAYDGFTGNEPPSGSPLTPGTESVMSPVPNQWNVTPTLHSNVSNNISWARNHSMEQPELKKPSSSSAEPVLSNKPSSNVSPHDSSVADKVNAMRRNKVVQVKVDWWCLVVHGTDMNVLLLC